MTPDVQQMGREWNYHPPLPIADTVTVTLASGETLSQTVREVAGGPARPMSGADRRAKFVACRGDEQNAARILGSAWASAGRRLQPSSSQPNLPMR